MSAMMRVLGILSAQLWATTLSGELSTELRNKRQSSDEYIEDRKVVCYYANWAVYRQGNAKFTPQNINPYLCTHLIYAFGGLGKDDSIVPFDEYQDIEKGGYGRFAALKTYNKDLKTMLAIGGWNEGSKRFSPLVADPDRRQVFIKSALRFLRQYNFDGLDLDWEYPTQRQGGRPQDRINYGILITEMREAFESEAEKTGKERLLISMAVPASLEYAGKGYDIETLDKSLDFFNLLTYDYHSAQEPAVNHHSPLYRPDDWSEFDFRKDLNIDATIKFYLRNGASRHKLVLGIPTYGRSYTLANPDAHEISSPATGPGDQGTGTKEDGYLAYYEICEKILEDGWDIVTPYPGIMGPYAHKGNQWVGFDDVDIAVEKAFYVAEEELGGIMFWTIDNDDFRGSCGKTPYPLIESAKEAMYSVQSSVKTKTSVSVSTSEQTRVTRLRLTPQELANLATSPEESGKKKVERPSPPRRQDSPRSLSGSVTTPAPPTTPRSGPAFKCKNEGFFAHPANCKKYYWCLDTPSQGMVAHTFSCPQGLFFNQITDGCDFLRNVDCGDKQIKETEPKKKAAVKDNSINDETEDDEDDVEDPKSLKDILEIVKAAGGVEGLEKQIEEEEEAKKEEEDRRVRISSKTRNRLSQLLNRGQSPKPQRGGDNKDQALVSRPKISVPRLTTQSPSSTRSSSNSRSDASRNSLLSRLASKRRNLSPRVQNRVKPNFSREAIIAEELENSSSEEDSVTSPTQAPKRTTSARSFSRKTSLFRNRSRFSSSRERTASKPKATLPKTRSRSPALRTRFRNVLSRTTPAPTTTPPPVTDPLNEESFTTLNPENNQEDESNQKIMIVGAHLEPEEPEEQALHLGVFKPKAGVREKLRETLHTVLEHEMAERGNSRDEEEPSTIAPQSTVTISRNSNTRIKEARQRENVKSFVGRQRKLPTQSSKPRNDVSQDSNRYVTIQRGGGTTPTPDIIDDSINQVGGDFILQKSEHLFDTEFSLAKLKKNSRVKRDDVDIIYPSDSSFPEILEPQIVLPVSNDVSYVFPETYNPRGGRQNDIQIIQVIDPVIVEPYIVEPYIVEPVIIEPVTNLILTTNSLLNTTTPTSLSTPLPTTTTNTPFQSSSTTKPTPEISPSVTEFPESSQTQSRIISFTSAEITTIIPKSIPTTMSPEINTFVSIDSIEQDIKENEIDDDFDDYADWGVVVSVVKSVSESDSSITLIQHQTTPMSKEEPKETTTIIDEITTLKNLVSEFPSTSTKETSLVSEKERTTILPTFKTHPFINSHKNNSSNLGHQKIHPFLNQIKSLNSPPGFSNHLSTNGITIVPWNTTTTFTNANISSTTNSIITTASTVPSLFGRFNFLNKGKRPDFKHSAKPTKTTKPTKSTTLSDIQSSSQAEKSTQLSLSPKPVTTESSFLKSIQSRLTGHRRPPFNSFLSKKSYKKTHEDVADKISNEISVTEKTKSTKSNEISVTEKTKFTKPSFSSRFSKKNRPSFRRPNKRPSFSNLGVTSTREPPPIIEKPRPKRLPSGFGGTRPQSFIKPRPFSNRFFKQSLEEPTSPQDSDQSSTTTEKQTVGDIIAQLNGETEDEAKPSTLRPKAFRPKSGSSNKIRESLQAELAEVKKEAGGDGYIPDLTDIKDFGESTTAVNIRKFNRETTLQFNRETTLQRILPTRIANTDRKSSGNRRFPSNTDRFQPRTRLRSRTKIQTTNSPSTSTIASYTSVQEETNPEISTGEKVLTENDIMDKLGLTVVRTEQPDTTIDTEELEVKGIVDIVHDGESLTTSENEVLSTQSPFQVLIDANDNNEESDDHDDHDDHVHDIVHEHHPEIHFRHLKPDLLPEEPRLSSEELGSGVSIDISDVFEESHQTSNEIFLPTMFTITTLPPRVITIEVDETKEFVPATAQAFLPTIDQGPTSGFLPTVSRASSRSRGVSKHQGSSSVPQSRRNKLKLRRRNRVENEVKATQETVTSRPRNISSAPRTRPRTRTRSRTRVSDTKTENNENKKEETGEQKVVPSRRITNPRRLLSRARTNSAPVFRANTPKPRASFRNNQRLRVRGGGRRSTEAPEVTEITEKQEVVSSTVKIDFEVETEKPLEGKFTTVVVEGLADLTTVVEPIHTTEGVVTTLTINVNEETTEVIGSTVTEEVSTLRPGKFKPKFGSSFTRDKLRALLRKELENNKSKSFEFGPKKVLDDFELAELPVKGSDREVIDPFETTDLPLFDSAFSDFDITSHKQAPTTARISFEEENFIGIEEVSPSQPQRRSQRRISHETAQDPLLTRSRSRFRHSNPVRKRSNNSQLRSRKRTRSTNSSNNEDNVISLQKQRFGKSANPVFYDQRRRRRQPIRTEQITEAVEYDDTLFRVGRSTVVDSHMTDGPEEGHHTDTFITATTSMDRAEEETTQKMVTIEQQETHMTDEPIVNESTTQEEFKDTTTEIILREKNEVEEALSKPFLLRSGKKEKSIFRDRYKDSILSRLRPNRANQELKSSESSIKNKFSRFRPGLPVFDHVDSDEKVSGPNIDTSTGFHTTSSNSADNIKNETKNDTSLPIESGKKSVVKKEPRKIARVSKLKSGLFSRNRKQKVFKSTTERAKDDSIVKEPTTQDEFKDTTTEVILEEKNEVKEVPVKPFLLRSGKKEKSIFRDRYKNNRVKETTQSPVTESKSESVIQNSTTTEKTVQKDAKTSKTVSNIFANPKRHKFNSKFSQQFSHKRSSLLRPKPSVEKISTESVKPNISLDSESVTTPQPLSQILNNSPKNETTSQTNSSSSRPTPSKSSSSKILSSPAQKRFPFRSGSKKSSLSNLFNRRNKHKKSPILSHLTTTTPPSEETTLTSAQEEKNSQGGDDVNTDESSSIFRPTVSDILISTDASTLAPFFPTFVPVNAATEIPEKQQTTPEPVILITQAPREQPRRDSPRKLEIFNLKNDLTDTKSSDRDTVRLGNQDDDDKSISREQSLFKEVQDNVRSSEVPQRSSRPFVGRPLRPVPSRNQDASFRLRSSSKQRSRSRSREPITTTTTRPTTRPSTRPTTRPTTRFETNFEPSEPEQPASPVQSSRVLSPEDLIQALVPAPSPATRIARPQAVQSRRKEPKPQSNIPVRKARPQVNPFDKIVPQKSTQSRNRNLVRPAEPATPLEPASNTEFEYEYYYDYLDDDHDKPNTDYDLVPLANKVRILSDGLPHCLDVGVFPHPFSCKKFVNCFRNPGTGIVGSIYQCPSYLAFDPVGGRCNWVNEIVCAASK